MLKRVLKRALPLLIVFTMLTACSTSVNQTFQKQVKAKNIILLIGDGMGVSQLTLGRALKEVKGETFSMDTLPIFGLVNNRPADPEESWITDSAASATAIATGTSTVNGYVGVDPDGKPVTSILELAKQNGLKTGLVASSTIYHATPAAFTAHNSERGEDAEIIADMLSEDDVDVMLGGGLAGFEGTGAIDTAKNQGYSIIKTKEELKNTSPGDRVIGLFSDLHMPYVIDEGSAEMPTLEEMTSQALKLLDNKEGFFLMVEGSKIDMACHDADVGAAAYETAAFDDAVKVAMDFASDRNDTLVIVTADHETGGLSIGSTSDNSPHMIFNPEVISKRVHSLGPEIMRQGMTVENMIDFVKDNFGLDITKDDVEEIVDSGDPWGTINQMFLDAAGVAFGTEDHSGSNVPIMAYGPGMYDFSGYMKNTDIFTKMKSAFGY